MPQSMSANERSSVNPRAAVNSKCYTCVQLPSCVGMENSGGFVFSGWYYATNNSGTIYQNFTGTSIGVTMAGAQILQ